MPVRVSAPNWREWNISIEYRSFWGAAAQNSRAKAPVETAVSNSATTSTTVRERSARRYTGDNPLRDGVYGGKKRFNAILAEFTDAWLLMAWLAGGLLRVILIILLQSVIVRCGDTGRIETAIAAI
ncbi:hypothetical protein GWE18_40245 [Bradyrhizobium sp. CSA112]|uniref:hypothetical protein n=1 Tax=Bradyrhizobium sp. CSA112 TaxID=2699170 RepID=UPI0023B0FDAF|nr:hypothetical protein [Bradyrhizobium sp. CSA112]MDE5458858.1 hypothetical protein [Bradyrhizobium sp. CSA112]